MLCIGSESLVSSVPSLSSHGRDHSSNESVLHNPIRKIAVILIFLRDWIFLESSSESILRVHYRMIVMC